MTSEQIDWDFKITDYSVLENIGKGTKQIKRQKQQQHNNKNYFTEVVE